MLDSIARRIRGGTLRRLPAAYRTGKTVDA
jgi:hypothetical protein